jgi:phage terminase large subunit-like protein
LAIGPPQQRPRYEPAKRRLTWPNGAIATTYSADEPERLRGPQHDAAWCDEIASQEAAFRFYMTILAVLIFVNQSDGDLAARARGPSADGGSEV